MPKIAYTGRIVKQVYFEGRKVKRLWYQGRVVFQSELEFTLTYNRREQHPSRKITLSPGAPVTTTSRGDAVFQPGSYQYDFGFGVQSARIASQKLSGKGSFIISSSSTMTFHNMSLEHPNVLKFIKTD